MTPLRPFINLAAQLWYSLDTANAVRHGNPVSDRARVHCMSDSANASGQAVQVPA